MYSVLRSFILCWAMVPTCMQADQAKIINNGPDSIIMLYIGTWTEMPSFQELNKLNPSEDIRSSPNKDHRIIDYTPGVTGVVIRLKNRCQLPRPEGRGL